MTIKKYGQTKHVLILHLPWNSFFQWNCVG